jgi:hypothetical protein
LNATRTARLTPAFAVAMKLAAACAPLIFSACAITEIRDSDNRSSWSLHVLRDAGAAASTSGLTYVRSRALGWQQTGSEYTFGLLWREAVIARDVDACALVVLFDASHIDAAKLNEQTRFFSTLGNCHVVPLSKG